eukprot:3659265-Pyramimonas_sp.AAC.1
MLRVSQGGAVGRASQCGLLARGGWRWTPLGCQKRRPQWLEQLQVQHIGQGQHLQRRLGLHLHPGGQQEPSRQEERQHHHDGASQPTA